MSVQVMTNDRFEKEVVQAQGPVLLDFYADWCGPCKMIAPVVAQIAEENPDIKVAKINVDEETALARSFGVSSIPTLVVMKDGKVTSKHVGYMGKSQILAMLKK